MIARGVQHHKQALTSMFPDSVAVNITAFRNTHGQLFPEEEECIQYAHTLRQEEFRVGRICARELLCSFGHGNTPLVMGSDRAPIWPGDVVGSISHTNTLCTAVVAHKADIQSIGIDIAQCEALDETLYDVILTEKEISWLTSLPYGIQKETATLIFSAKEAFYKCQYTLTHRWLDFLDVEVDLAHQTPDSSFGISVISECDTLGKLPFHGRYRHVHDHVLTGMYVTNTEGAFKV